MDEKIIAVVKNPYEPPKIVAIDKGYKTLQKIVDGDITGADLPDMDDVFGFANDDGLSIGLEPNIYRPEYKDALVGTIVFTGNDGEGESISLTPEQIKKVSAYLEQNSVSDFGEFIYNIQTEFSDYKPKKSAMEYGETDYLTFGIYQLNGTDEAQDLLFLSYDQLQKHNHKVDVKNYECVYVAPHKGESLEELFDRFNNNHPKDYCAHSLSVSDVVVLRDGKQQTAYFVDTFGFKEVPEFFGGEPLAKKSDMEM